MIPREFRLKSKKDFERIYREKGARGSFFIVKSRENRYGIPRVGIVVPKKVSAKSVTRNLIKRRVAEIIHKRLKGIKDRDIAIFLLPAAANASFLELKTEIDRAFEQRKLFK